MEPDGSVRRLGVMGGTFDPIHVGHLSVASEVADDFGLDRMLFVPAGVPWQKDGYSGAEDRWMMTAIATESDARFQASRMEIDRKGPTYTVDTMAVLRDFYGPEVELFFVTGLDSAITLGTWHRVGGLAGLADVVVVPRPGFDASALHPAEGWPRIHLARTTEIDVSSTEIRRRAAAGEPVDGLVPPAVARYMRERGLYVPAEERSA